MNKSDVNVKDTTDNTNINNIRLELSPEDMQRMYGLLLSDAAKTSKEESDRYNLLLEKYNHRKKVDFAIIYGLITIIIAIIVSLTVIFSTMTIVIDNGSDPTYGEVTLYDDSKIDSDNTTSNITTDTYNNYVDTEGVK